ncbi:MAG: hypothetical protein JWQ43_3225 [Glaciihabitans sp.]|nr:hypothetical protein [Glaciihabitans sp.]
MLERIRAKAPDFTEFQYQQQLDDSVALTLELRRSSVKQRKEAVSTALRSDVLNAVFDLRFSNIRFAADEKTFYGFEPIDIHQALRSLWAAEDITSAVHRADALLSAGAQFSWCGGEVYLEQQRQIAEAHPGYTPENLREALGRGFFLNR